MFCIVRFSPGQCSGWNEYAFACSTEPHAHYWKWHGQRSLYHHCCCCREHVPRWHCQQLTGFEFGHADGTREQLRVLGWRTELSIEQHERHLRLSKFLERWFDAANQPEWF